MKAYLTRSPIFVHLDETDLNDAILDIWIEDNADNFDVSNPTNYSLFANAIDEKVTFEISELLRSENDFLTDDFLTDKRDTAKWALLQITGRDDSLSEVEKKTFLIRFRDGYIERDAQPQIIKSEITNQIADVMIDPANIVSSNEADPFGGNNAYEVNQIGNIESSVSTVILEKNKKYTFQFFVKKKNTTDSIEIRFDGNIFNVNYETQNYDVLVNTSNNKNEIDQIGDWYRYNVSYELTSDILQFALRVDSKDSNDNITNFFFYGLNIYPYDQVQTINDFLLQDVGITKPDDSLINLMFDRLWTNNTLEANALLDVGGSTIQDDKDIDINADLSKHSVAYEVRKNTIDLEINNTIDNTGMQTRELPIENVNECKYENHKVEFINRYGVVQVLWFFFKRTDTLDQDNESYKPHQVNNGVFNRNLGGERLIQKQGKRKTKLSSGFYPESFNSAFQQLFYSLNVWLDGEPVKVTDSSHQVKTQLNDKIINYDVQFEFTNKEVNNIR